MNYIDLIKRVRLARDYSQEYMAKQLGIAPNNYSLLERGSTALTVDRLYKLAEILDVPIDYFFRVSDEVIDLYLLPEEERKQRELELNKEIDIYENIEKINTKLDLLKKDETSISIGELKNLGNEISQKSKEGFGLVDLGYDLIRGRFKPIYKELKKPFDPETEINHVTDQISQIVKEMDSDSKALKSKKKK